MTDSVPRTCHLCGATTLADPTASFSCVCGEIFFWGIPKERKHEAPKTPLKISSPRDENAFLNSYRKTNPSWEH